MSTTSRVRVAFYGCGNFANRTRIPNVLQTNSADIVATCDSSLQTAQETATRFKIPRVYQDAHEMLDTEAIDVLYSIVPAYVRTDIEVTAAQKGIHIFSEKPQALTMQVAHRINNAIQQAGVISTVGFRERYRPIFQEARQYLIDKQIVHVRFRDSAVCHLQRRVDLKHGGKRWTNPEDRLSTGVFIATDYTRFMTGLNVAKSQAFYCQRRLMRMHCPPVLITALRTVLR